MDGQYWKGDRTMSTNEWLLTSDFWQFLEPWHGRWYEYEIFIASCTDNIYDLENERWLLGDMIDHVGIYGSRVAEGLSAFNVGLVIFGSWTADRLFVWLFIYFYFVVVVVVGRLVGLVGWLWFTMLLVDCSLGRTTIISLLYFTHRIMTHKSLMPPAPSCIDNSWRSTTLRHSGFGYLQPQTSGWEWASMSTGKNQITGSFVATNFPAMFLFQSKFHFLRK